MPPHPLDACCGHLISQAVSNINRLASSGSSGSIRDETVHIAPVVEMLEEYLLRKDHDQLKASAVHYWKTTRPEYLRVADRQSINGFDMPWDFFAFSLNLPYSKDVTPPDGESL
jgi:hypothetical protein